MELHEQLDEVNDSATFLRFARALAADKATGNGWENTTIEAFLDGAISWAEDSDFGLSQGLTPSNPWQQFAVFLYCGKIYE
ncbi:DUF7660 family protein [Pseudomonas schmalbachii]|uniref:DUF7660 domain-containing protein n=1 Tax=Pseudomonas schmalbachii TaxID=2816993 RepID=A0ABS3TM89_9PSED|nr:hypothetical protein [Pseudomonas schmalbachii]MBO3273704.1 hypothetical protein [Pseudomonas schmalbachii]